MGHPLASKRAMEIPDTQAMPTGKTRNATCTPGIRIPANKSLRYLYDMWLKGFLFRGMYLLMARVWMG